VQGTAGSGKTQLALQMLREAHRRGEPALYLCFNRPLADAMRAVAPASASTVTFHEFARLALAAAGETPDFGAPEVYATLSAGFARLAPSLAGTFGTLIIDEGQDFEPAWALSVLSFRGLERSRIAGAQGPSRLAGQTVSRPAGYDARGLAQRTPGTLLVDTVYRFKGQAADAVVLTEIDFEMLDEAARRRLFVGLSRARLQVALVSSRRASEAMLAALDPAA
jgi:hypothetical protein